MAYTLLRGQILVKLVIAIATINFFLFENFIAILIMLVTNHHKNYSVIYLQKKLWLCPVTVTVTFTDHYRFRANVTQRDINVTDRY